MRKTLSTTTATVDQKKTVCMLVHSFYLNDSRVKRSATSLVKFGYDVHVFAFWPSCDSFEKTIDGVKIYQQSLAYSGGKKRFLAMMWAAKNAVQNSTLKPDIIHTHDLDTLIPAVYLAKKFKTKLIYDSHEWNTGSIHLINKKKEQLIWAFIEKAFIRFCDKVITVNDSIANLFEQQYSLSNHVWVVRNFDQIPTALDEISPKIIEEIANFKKGFEHTIIYGGYIQEGRGLSLLVKSLKTNSKLGCIIAGDGGYMSELSELVDKLEIQNQVVFTGMLPLNELYYCYKQADIGYCYIEPLSKSYELALPNKLSQYVQCELAVLGSNLVEIARLIEKYEVGIVVKDEQDLTISLQKILQNLAFYKSKCKSFASNFNWENESIKLHQLYKSLDG